MSDKQLKDKAISIKGKDYVLVSDRVTYFNDNYPNGSITTDYELVGNTYICKATVTPDIDKPERKFNGLSQATIHHSRLLKNRPPFQQKRTGRLLGRSTTVAVQGTEKNEGRGNH